jgi:2-oxoglutarate ferredoxin oxidoreductase subunit beta
MTETYTPATPIWCAGCGHFGVEGALRVALHELDIPAHETFVLAGIGCSGTIQNNMGTYGYHALHGRVLPTATGAALSDPRLTVVAAGGDGDGYAIGGGHLIHTFRRNPSMTYVLMNNAVYGLTKGQPSPTANASGTVNDAPLDGILLGLSIPGSTFLARGFARWFDQLRELTVAALRHARSGKGFAFLEVLSPCVTYNDTYPSWEASIVDLDAEASYDPSDRAAAFTRCVTLADEGRIPVGMIYSGGPGPIISDPGPAHTPIRDLTAAYAEVMASYQV